MSATGWSQSFGAQEVPGRLGWGGMSLTTMAMQDTTSWMLCDQLHGRYKQQSSFIFCLFSDLLQWEVAVLAPPTGEEARSSSEGDIHAGHTGTEL